jgi:hypothetical protein
VLLKIDADGENLKTRLLAKARGEISFRELRQSHRIDEAQVRQLAAVFPQAFRIEKRQGDMGRPSWIVASPLEEMKKSPIPPTPAPFQK